jgi:hypothetical protein
MSDLERRLDTMLAAQELDPALVQEIMALSPDDPVAARILAKLLTVVGEQGPSPALNIEDYYRPGVERYTLRWPLAPTTLAALPVPFEELDHKTQFYVLFQEWTRRELEGNVARNAGDLAGARAIFEECLERAEQLDVAELKARSYEGLMSVAEREGDPDAARRALEAALAARAASDR